MQISKVVAITTSIFTRLLSTVNVGARDCMNRNLELVLVSVNTGSRSLPSKTASLVLIKKSIL